MYLRCTFETKFAVKIENSKNWIEKSLISCEIICNFLYKIVWNNAILLADIWIRKIIISLNPYYPLNEVFEFRTPGQPLEYSASTGGHVANIARIHHNSGHT